MDDQKFSNSFDSEQLGAWCVLKSASLADGVVEVRCKPVAGRQDQAGGGVWTKADSVTAFDDFSCAPGVPPQ